MGSPDGVQSDGDTEILKYANRLMSGFSWDTTDYFVTLREGRVVGYGNGQVRQRAAPQFPAYTPAPNVSGAPATSGTVCFSRGETTTGQTKQCLYDCLGSTVVQTQNAVSLCPLTINR